MAAPIALLYDLLVGVVAAAWLVRDRRAPAAAPWEGWVLVVLCLAAIGGPRTGEIWRVPLYPLIALAIFTLAAARAWREVVLRTAPQAFTQS
jgi:peptidoglycan/LPS O-acetylase OafA/YrhL